MQLSRCTQIPEFRLFVFTLFPGYKCIFPALESRITAHKTRTKLVLKFVRDISAQISLCPLYASVSFRDLGTNRGANSWIYVPKNSLVEAIPAFECSVTAAKERGTVLGGRRVSAERFAEIGAAARQTFSAQAAKGRAQVLPVIAEIQGKGISTLRAIAAELNAREIDAPRGGQWAPVQVRRVLTRVQ